MHPQVELLDDLLKAVLLILSTLGAVYARKAHRTAEEVNKAVNAVDDPNAKTLRENVQELHDEVVTRTTGSEPGA